MAVPRQRTIAAAIAWGGHEGWLSFIVDVVVAAAVVDGWFLLVVVLLWLVVVVNVPSVVLVVRWRLIDWVGKAPVESSYIVG